jgi:hypothetical protein
MTPKQQRNLLFALLAAGALIVITTSIIALTRSRRDMQIDAPAPNKAHPGGFSFFNVDRSTVLTGDLREKLAETLGSDAIAHATPIDLTVVNPAFLKTVLPELDRLNQQLNPPLGERREHPTTRLTYLRAERHAMPFRYIELVFSRLTGLPLYFIIKPTEEMKDSIETLTSKYGPPQQIQTDDLAEPVRIWKQKGDYLVATRFRRRNGRLVQELRIYFVSNLHRLVETEEQARRRQDRRSRRAGESVF